MNDSAHTEMSSEMNTSPYRGLHILSCGAGMQSTALALMSCENALHGKPYPYPKVPVYDLIVFCDLGEEPYWVYNQVWFIKQACKMAGISFVVLKTGLYKDYLDNFGVNRVVSVPFWTIGADGSKAKLWRNCTIDYKIIEIQKYVKYSLLGYKPYQRSRPEDIGAHYMHIGFSAEEAKRAYASKHPFYTNVFPLIEMGLTRADNYKYNLETWGLDTKASACTFCPFHRNYFFEYIRQAAPRNYAALIQLDRLLDEKQSFTPIRSKMFISRSRKRIEELSPGECQDQQTFSYRGKPVWNGF